ncbi:hypothetical protein AB0L05_14225 [Nonomuraea pusilla]|uniref:hypothetical protein n=1 Tax=Nonomuraea pusilla TaxID=46177 RepID=UPI003330C095
MEATAATEIAPERPGTARNSKRVTMPPRLLARVNDPLLGLLRAPPLAEWPAVKVGTLIPATTTFPFVLPRRAGRMRSKIF